MQGGHELLDLKSKRVITRRKVVEIPVTHLVIQAVEQMAKDDGIKELKYTSKYGVEETNDWLAGVNDNDTNSEDNQTESDQNEDESSNNDENHAQITGVDRQDYNEEKENNPIIDEEFHNDIDQTVTDINDSHDSVQDISTRRSQRQAKPVNRIQPSMTGQSYDNMATNTTTTTLEQCHNMTINEDDNVNEYSHDFALFIVQAMDIFN